MTNVERAIVFLQHARDLVDEEARWREPGPDTTDLGDIAEDLGKALYHLESFVKVRT